jgi:hypothetical protein
MLRGGVRLAVISTIVQAFIFCWHYRLQFYLIALPAIIVLAILSTLVTSLLPTTFQHTYGFNLFTEQSAVSNETFGYTYGISFWRSFADVCLFFLMAGSLLFYSVAWHRFFLVPNEDVKIVDCYRWKARHSLFLWSNMKIFLFIIPIGGIGLLLTLASVVFAPLVGVVIIFLVCVCYARFSMWLPAAALEQKMTLKEALVLTRGNGRQLAAILILTTITSGILDVLAGSLISYASLSLGTVGVLTQSLLTNFALYLITYAGTALGISALSISYQKLIEADGSQ